MGIPVPPPWVLMSLVLGFAGHLNDFKELAGLGLALVTGRGEDAGCKVCDRPACPQRAFPPVGRRLAVDEAERRFAPYPAAEA